MNIKFIKFTDISISIIFPLLVLPSQLCYTNNIKIPENVFGEPKKISTNWKTYIKSVKAYKTGFELSQPVIELNTDETITLEFDDLSNETEQYEYTIIHCDYSWNPSSIAFMEYADGFMYTPIYNSQNSVGTLVQYRHYALTLPNSNLKLKLSGNYILQVVRQSNRNEIILQQQFRVYEPLVKVDALIRQPIEPSYQHTHQQLELKVNTALLGNVDPYSDVVVLVNQNNQPYNELTLQAAQYIHESNLIYNTSTSPLFEGGNEYRELNLKSFHYQNAQIRGIKQYNDAYHTLLTPEERVKTYRYSERTDINGKYIVKCDDVTESKVEADYTWVYFTLSNDFQFDGDIFLFGELSGWEINPNFKMNYNQQNGNYELKILLKQGYYNYKYVFVSHSSNLLDFNRIEANFNETENTYNIYAYFKSQGARYWRLVGFKAINSRNG